MDVLETLNFSTLSEITKEAQKKALRSLEEGKIVFLPHFSFELEKEERAFLSPEVVDPKSKNVSYSLAQNRLGGFNKKQPLLASGLNALMKRYAIQSKGLIETLFPSYVSEIKLGRTSFRPVEAQGRTLSKRKDDTRLHIDAFPANPVQGKRILRVFTNVNPSGKPRIWNVGEPFEQVVEKFKTKMQSPFPGSSFLLKLFKMTKSTRSLYDHYMLKLHDAMKKDDAYQNLVVKKEVHFPPESSWIVFTDQVSHAALGGQYLLEQTSYLPVKAQAFAEWSPLKVLERAYQKKLIP